MKKHQGLGTLIITGAYIVGLTRGITRYATYFEVIQK